MFLYIHLFAKVLYVCFITAYGSLFVPSILRQDAIESSFFFFRMWLSITCANLDDLLMEMALAEVPCRCVFRPSCHSRNWMPHQILFYTAILLQCPHGGVISYKRSLRMTLTRHTDSGENTTKDPCTKLSPLLPTSANRTNRSEICRSPLQSPVIIHRGIMFAKVLYRARSSYADECCLQKSPADDIPLDMAAYSWLMAI